MTEIAYPCGNCGQRSEIHDLRQKPPKDTPKHLRHGRAPNGKAWAWLFCEACGHWSKTPLIAADSKKLRLDANEIAYRTLLAATGEGPKPTPPGEGEKNLEAVKRGAKGGKKGGAKGGKQRAANLTEDSLSKAATTAALARWKKGT